MRILAVDDDDSIRELLREILRTYGYGDVRLAASGRDAIEAINKAPVPFDCILLDIQMPVMDGIHLCRIIREMPDYVQTPIVMITAMNGRDYVDRAFKAGATDYVTKPFDPQELGSRIRVANLLVTEMRKNRQREESTTRLRRPTFDNRNFNEAFVIEDVPGVVSLNVLSNYLDQLGRIRQWRTSAFAVRIVESERMFWRVTRDQYTSFLTDIADVLSDLIAGTSGFITYFGDGAFLCVMQKDAMPDLRLLEGELNEALVEPDAVYADGETTAFSAIVGAAVTQGLFTSDTTADFLTKSVRRLVETEFSRKAHQPQISPTRIVRAVA